MKIQPASSVITSAINALVAVDATLARASINEVVCNGNANCIRDLASANGRMADAAADLARGKFDNAIQHYRSAWHFSMKAMRKPVDDDDDDECSDDDGDDGE